MKISSLFLGFVSLIAFVSMPRSTMPAQSKHFSKGTVMSNPRHQQSILTSINKEAEMLPVLALESAGNDKLWEASVKKGDGMAEQEYRMKLHENLDQLLDLRARILQLVRRATY